jgi:protoheme ferro-lyase
METIGKRADSHIFAMSEFQVHNVTIDEEASPYYMKPTVKEAFDALMAETQAMRSLIVAGTVSAESMSSLRQAIERAEQALKNATEIKTVYAPSFKPETIYNLSGQRVSKAQKGIYIINGKKVLF